MKSEIKNIVVLGGGESGVGAAILARKNNIDVFVSDAGTIKHEYKHELDYFEIEWEEGTHSIDRILAADYIVKSPGIPDKAPVIRQALEKGIDIISEIELGYMFTDAKCIGITGTNGKTTTTSLTYYILKNAGLNVGLGGNIGKSFARSVAEDSYQYYVLELSSFQLDGIKDYKSYISILLNITPDHLDRYDYNFENYIKSKFRITLNQTANDYFIYNYDDPIIRERVNNIQILSKKIPISQNEEIFPGGYIKDDTIYIGINQKNEFTMKLEDMALKGVHNRYNTLAAGVATKILNIRKDVVRESLKSFQNVEHRLEPVAIINGVEYINDSKATNVHSAWFALESVKKPIIWIAGGVDKGNDYETLLPMVKERVKAIICLGKDNKGLHDAFGDVIHKMIDTLSMKEAVKLAAGMAAEGDAVLLAPACASFDLFQNYEERGRLFKYAVLSLL